jgi:hypothetical protein
MIRLFDYKLVKADSDFVALHESINSLKKDKDTLNNQLSWLLGICVVAGIAMIVVGFYTELHTPKVHIDKRND